MIRLKNTKDFVIQMSVPGTQAVGNDLEVNLVPFAGQIKAIYAKLGTAGTTSTQVTDIKKNGVSIFSSGGLSFATGSQACTYGALTQNPTQVAQGDILRIDTTAINTTPGKDLAIFIVVEKLPGGQVAAMLTDAVQ